MVTGAREAFGYSATRRESYHPWNRSGEATKAENRHELMEDVSVVESSLHRAWVSWAEGPTFLAEVVA